jgi:hypothetical protein
MQTVTRATRDSVTVLILASEASVLASAERSLDAVDLADLLAEVAKVRRRVETAPGDALDQLLGLQLAPVSVD